MLNLNHSIYIAGHQGLIGSAFLRRFSERNHPKVVTRTRAELDLRDPLRVRNFFAEARPDIVLLCAARVGGIIANRDFPADFITENLEIELNVIREANRSGVSRLIFFGSSCMYPKLCPQPIAETSLWQGDLEKTSLPYAVAKLAGLTLCQAYNEQFRAQNFLTVIPNNTYGPGDDFNPQSSHVLSGLLRRIWDAAEKKADAVTLWGSGNPRREFIYVDDVVDACLMLLQRNLDGIEFPINVGTGADHSIRELGEIIAEIVGFRGQLEFDPSKPDGTPRKLLDSSKMLALGWKAKTTLRDGIRQTLDWFLKNCSERAPS